MAIPPKPVITAAPPAPQRTDTPTEFADKADTYVSWQAGQPAQLNAAIDWQNLVFTEIDTLASQAQQSAANAAQSAAAANDDAQAAAGSASQAASSRDQAETYAGAAQSAAGIPAFAGKSGFPLAVNAAGTGVEYTGRYQLAVVSTTATLDLAQQQVFLVDATTSRTLEFANAPGADRVMAVVVRLTGGTGSITWPAGINWSNGLAPSLRASWTVVSLLWDGSAWRGFVSGGRD